MATVCSGGGPDQCSLSRHITSYHVDQCWSMLVNVVYIRCVRIYLVSVVEMCEAGNFIASFKFAIICLKLGFKNLRRGTEPFPLLLSFEDQLLHLSMTCVQLIDLHCLSQPLLSLSLSVSVRRHPFDMPNFTKHRPVTRTMTAPWHHLHPFALELFIKVANVEAKPPDCRLCQC